MLATTSLTSLSIPYFLLKIEIYILQPVNKLHTTLIHKDVILAQISIYDPK